jgi:putative membrane protein
VSGRRDRQQNEAAMRWLYVIVIIAFVAAVVIFAVQNLEVVNMSFLGFSLRAPLALVAVIVYVLGAITGGGLLALLRKSIRESKLTGIQ